MIENHRVNRRLQWCQGAFVRRRLASRSAQLLCTEIRDTAALLAELSRHSGQVSAYETLTHDTLPESSTAFRTP